MTETPANAPTATPAVRPRALSKGEKVAAHAIGWPGFGIGLLGFFVSFNTLTLAFSGDSRIPFGIDLAIAVFYGAHLLLIRLAMGLWWLRFIPHALLAATVFLNIRAAGAEARESALIEAARSGIEANAADIAAHVQLAQVGHGVMPLLWGVFVEIAGHAVSRWLGMTSGSRMEGIRLSRWVLAPWPTFQLWRRMKLWEITSYRDALTMERERLLAVALLGSQYGRLKWRWRAPLLARVELRLAAAPKTSAPAAEIAPAGAATNSGAGGVPPWPAPDHAPVAPSPAAGSLPEAAPVPAIESAPVDAAPVVPEAAPVPVTERSAPGAPVDVPERSGEPAPVTTGAPAPEQSTGAPERPRPEQRQKRTPERSAPRRRPPAKNAPVPTKDEKISAAVEAIVEHFGREKKTPSHRELKLALEFPPRNDDMPEVYRLANEALARKKAAHG